jgi:hypothetical protein
MRRLVVALFEDPAQAERARMRLVLRGFEREDVDIVPATSHTGETVPGTLVLTVTVEDACYFEEVGDLLQRSGASSVVSTSLGRVGPRLTPEPFERIETDGPVSRAKWSNDDAPPTRRSREIRSPEAAPITSPRSHGKSGGASPEAPVPEHSMVRTRGPGAYSYVHQNAPGWLERTGKPTENQAKPRARRA